MDTAFTRLVRILTMGGHLRSRNGSTEGHSRGLEWYRGPAVQGRERGQPRPEFHETIGRC